MVHQGWYIMLYVQGNILSVEGVWAVCHMQFVNHKTYKSKERIKLSCLVVILICWYLCTVMKWILCVKYFERLPIGVNTGAKSFYIESGLAEPGTQCAVYMPCVFQYGQHQAHPVVTLTRRQVLQPLLSWYQKLPRRIDTLGWAAFVTVNMYHSSLYLQPLRRHGQYFWRHIARNIAHTSLMMAQD